jgi:hypothetical protein
MILRENKISTLFPAEAPGNGVAIAYRTTAESCTPSILAASQVQTWGQESARSGGFKVRGRILGPIGEQDTGANDS